MKNSTWALLIGGGFLAWWYFNTNKRRLRLTNEAFAQVGRPKPIVLSDGSVVQPLTEPMSGLGCCPGQPMGTMYSEDGISGPYGEFNIAGESGMIAPKQHTWDRMEDVSAL